MIAHIFHGLTEAHCSLVYTNFFRNCFLCILNCVLSSCNQCNRGAMEIERIVASGGSLLREDCNEYIAAGCDNG